MTARWIAMSLPVERIVIGCERVEQLENNLACLYEGIDSSLDKVIGPLASDLPLADDDVLDPSRWP